MNKTTTESHMKERLMELMENPDTIWVRKDHCSQELDEIEDEELLKNSDTVIDLEIERENITEDEYDAIFKFKITNTYEFEDEFGCPIYEYAEPLDSLSESLRGEEEDLGFEIPSTNRMDWKVVSPGAFDL